MKHSRALASTLIASTALVLAPTLAWAEPSSSASAKPAKGGNVIDGPDIAAGAKNAPGSGAITDIINAIGFYGIVACLIGLLLSGLILAIGPRLGFSQASTIGKVGIIASLGVAFLIGISATLVNYFYNAGA
jgi:hypothetical protein